MIWIGIQLSRCFNISLFSRVVLIVIFALFDSYGLVLNTTIGISDKRVRLIAFARLTFTPDNVNVSVSPSSTSTYSLTALSDANSCVAQSSDINSNTTVTVNPRPKAAISGGTTICNGGTTELSVALTGTQPWSLTYTTNYGGNSTPTTVSGITTSTYTFNVSPSTTTTYSLTALSDNNSCIAQPLVDFTTSSTIVNVNERPTAALSGTPITCDGTPTTIDVSLTGHSPWSLTYASSTGSPVTLTISAPNNAFYPIGGTPYTTTLSVTPVDEHTRYNFISPNQYIDLKKRKYARDTTKYFYVKDGYLYLPDSTVEVVDIRMFTIYRDQALSLCACNPEHKCKSAWDQEFICPDRFLDLIIKDTLTELGSIYRTSLEDANPNLDVNQKTQTEV